MTTNDALLFVGYEEDTGTVLSVAGVAVLGIRAPLEIGAMYTSKTPAGKKKFGTSADFEKGVAKGYADCIHAAGGSPPYMTDYAKHTDWGSGYMAGWEKCKKANLFEGGHIEVEPLKPIGHTPPAQISAPQNQPYEGGYTPVESLKPRASNQPYAANQPGEQSHQAAVPSSSMFNLAIRGW